jgi:hypothetical protein
MPSALSPPIPVAPASEILGAHFDIISTSASQRICHLRPDIFCTPAHATTKLFAYLNSIAIDGAHLLIESQYFIPHFN